jgi:hypothetical protein
MFQHSLLIAKFLYNLGLKRFPPLEVILDLAASTNLKTRTSAMNYFLDNYVTRYSDYNPANFSKVAFVPALEGGKQKLATPNEVRKCEWDLDCFSFRFF